MKVTIKATLEGVTTTIEYDGKKYVNKCIPIASGARYEGDDFRKIEGLSEELLDAVTGFAAYDLLNGIEKTLIPD